MKHWKLDLQKKSFVKTFIFYNHQPDKKAQFLNCLLKFDSKKYKIHVATLEEGHMVSFVLLEPMYKQAIDNIINSIELAFKEAINGEED